MTCLVKSGVDILRNDESLKRYLKELFTEFGETQRTNSNSYTYNKSPDNLIAIFNYMRDNIAPNSPVWRDSEIYNSMLPIAANSKEVTTLKALLQLNLINNVNSVDTTGKTALYYLITKQVDESLIQDLKNRGAVQTSADELALKQNKFATDFIRALESSDRSEIDQQLNILKINNLALSQPLFNMCFARAVKFNNIEIVISMLDTSYARNIKRFQYMIKNKHAKV